MHSQLNALKGVENLDDLFFEGLARPDPTEADVAAAAAAAAAGGGGGRGGGGGEKPVPAASVKSLGLGMAVRDALIALQARPWHGLAPNATVASGRSPAAGTCVRMKLRMCVLKAGGQVGRSHVWVTLARVCLCLRPSTCTHRRWRVSSVRTARPRWDRWKSSSCTTADPVVWWTASTVHPPERLRSERSKATVASARRDCAVQEYHW